jgi:nucleotide-binding universal stress UspA family protein
MRIQLKKIICSTDFSDLSNHAVKYAIALAKEFKAKLYLCHIIDLSSATMYGEATFAFEAQSRHMEEYAYHQLNAQMEGQGIEWQPLVTTGRAADEIARLAKENSVDLSIIATRGRSGLRRLVLGSVTEQLMRIIPCPLMAIRGPDKDTPSSFDYNVSYKRILVGCDFSHNSITAYQYGLSIAQEFQSDLYLAHVIPPFVYKDLPKSINDAREKLSDDLRVELKERLEKLVPAEAKNWCNPKTVLLAGDPHIEITKFALVQDMDLIVVGVKGQSLVESLLVGSTTDRILRGAICPVLCVRDATEKSD